MAKAKPPARRSPATKRRSAKRPTRGTAAAAAAPPPPVDLGLGDLRRIPAFGTVSDGDAATLLRVMEIRSLARGATVFEEGQEGAGLYAILSGRVMIRKRNAKGGDRELVTLVQNEVFGEMDLISDRPHTTSARGAEATRLLFLPKKAFRDLLRAGNPGATAMLSYFAVMLASRLDATNRRMLAMLESPEAERTSEFSALKRRLLQEWTF